MVGGPDFDILFIFNTVFRSRWQEWVPSLLVMTELSGDWKNC